MPNLSHCGRGSRIDSQWCSSCTRGLRSFMLEERVWCRGTTLLKIRFTCGSFQDAYEYIGDVDGIFVISSCTTTDIWWRIFRVYASEYRTSTTTRELPRHEIETVETVEGWNWIVKRINWWFYSTSHQNGQGWNSTRKTQTWLKWGSFQIIHDLEAKNLTGNKQCLQ